MMWVSLWNYCLFTTDTNLYTSLHKSYAWKYVMVCKLFQPHMSCAMERISPDIRSIACKDKAKSLKILVWAKCLTMDTGLLSMQLSECLTENISHFKCFYCSVMQLQYWALKLLFWTLWLGNGDCLGYRKPKQPYQWLSYKQVSIVNNKWINLGYCLVTLKWGNYYLAGFRQN